MPESSDQLERHIQEIQHDLKDNFSELEDKVKSSVDWRAQFEERPGTLLALAFGGGIVLSALLPRARSGRRPRRETDRTAQSIRYEPALSARSRRDDEAKPRQNPDAWSALKGAVLGAAAGKLSEFVEELLPGFKGESRKAQSGTDYSRSGSSSSWQKSNVAASG
jgi:hypothetical protein